MHPQADIAPVAIHDGFDSGQQRPRDNDVPRIAGAYGMGEAGAEKIDIEQRDHTTDMRQAKPDRDIFGAVRHREAHDVTGFQPLRQAPIRVTVRPRDQPRIGQRYLLIDQRQSIALRRRLPFDKRQQRGDRIAFDRLFVLKCPYPMRARIGFRGRRARWPSPSAGNRDKAIGLIRQYCAHDAS